MAIDPHGRFRPRLMCFLFGTMPQHPMAFDYNQANAAEMYRHLVTAHCPSGVIITATIVWNWKKNKSSPFFRGTHTAPTPAEYTMQQLALAVTKGFGLLLRQGSKRMGVKPPKYRVSPASNTSPDVLKDPEVNTLDESQQDTLAYAAQ